MEREPRSTLLTAQPRRNVMTEYPEFELIADILETADSKTVTRSDTLCLITTSNGTVETHEEATVYAKDLDIFFVSRWWTILQWC